MVTFSRCLCLILTLSIAGSQPGTAVRTDSPHPGTWWGSQGSLPIQEAATRSRAAGDFATAEKLYAGGYAEAQRRHDSYAMVRYLTSIGGCRLVLLHYRAALEAFIEARNLAASIGDREDGGAIAVNLSSIYLQMWDVDAALRAAEEGREAMNSLPRGVHPYFKPQLLLQLGRLHARLADNLAGAFFEEGIEAEREQGDVAAEARGWDLLGEARLRQHRLPEAERAVGEAFYLRALHDVSELGFSYYGIAALKLAQHDLDGAARFNARALAASAQGKLTWPGHLLMHQRGQIRQAEGREKAALSDFASALDLAERWKLGMLPASSSLTSANVEFEKQEFRSFIEAAASRGLRTGSASRTAESFDAAEMNRAASLRESLALAGAWRKTLPAEYWETLGKLSTASTALLRTNSETTLETQRLKLKLTEMEAGAGFALPVKKGENFRSQTSLIHFQEGLRDSEVLLSFHVGESESYLWALTRNALRLYRLAPADRIKERIEQFRDAVRTGQPAAEQMGERLYTELFGQLTREERSKSSWLLSLEGSLFELPFAALVAERTQGKVVYLVERHSLQVVPGALLLSRNSGAGARGGTFLGLGDPIYNVADPRWRAPSAPGLHDSGESEELGRLVGSAGEVEMSARSWRAGSGTATVLEGTNARRSRFLEALSVQPAVIHLATHVLTPPERPEQAFLAFGLGPSAGTELLATSDVAMLHVPGALVVMSGCATASGDVLAGAGLLGLTRAWLMAGASAVVATGWPVRDSDGEFFSQFYNQLRGTNAAEALRRTQAEMAHSDTWRRIPAYWASYQVTGGAR